MTRKPNRTRPLDRDGDGRDGGSLPGNQTATMAPPAWARDDARLIAKLQIIQATLDPALTDAAMADEVDGWTDAEAEAVEGFADAMAAPGRYQDKQGDERNADGSAIELPPILGRFLIGEEQARPEPTVTDDQADARTTPGDSPEKLEAIERETDEAKAQAATAATATFTDDQIAAGLTTPVLIDEADDQTDTFTPEEIAAGQTPVIEADGEASTIAADAAVTIPADDPLLQIETETAPIAVRERELRLLVENRRLYKSPMPSGNWGYSAAYGAPYLDETTVQGWIKAGLAEDIPTAGTWGGVKPSHEARRQLGLIRHGEAA